ncbi:hypothetical protein H4R34_006260, partial [Dimargaris verticillata]
MPPATAAQQVSPEVMQMASGKADSGLARAARTLVNLDRTIGQQGLAGTAFKSSLKSAFCGVNQVLNQNQNAVVLDSVAFTSGSINPTGPSMLLSNKVATRFYPNQGNAGMFNAAWLDDFVKQTALALPKAKSIAIIIGANGALFFRANIKDNKELVRALAQATP